MPEPLPTEVIPEVVASLPEAPSQTDGLLPLPPMEGLTLEESEEASRLLNAFNILGPAAGGALICPGNQIDVPDHERCPYAAKCVFLRARKAPAGHLCPIESQHMTQQFEAWTKEIEKTPMSLTASERAFVSELVWIAIQEARSTAVVSRGTAARLTQLNVKEVDEHLDPIAWERVIHSNVELLDNLSTRRRMLLKDWMISPEQKAKKARWEKKTDGQDQSVLQSAIAQKLKKVRRTLELEDDNPEI